MSRTGNVFQKHKLHISNWIVSGVIELGRRKRPVRGNHTGASFCCRKKIYATPDLLRRMYGEIKRYSTEIRFTCSHFWKRYFALLRMSCGPYLILQKLLLTPFSDSSIFFAENINFTLTL